MDTIEMKMSIALAQHPMGINSQQMSSLQSD